MTQLKPAQATSVGVASQALAAPRAAAARMMTGWSMTGWGLSSAMRSSRNKKRALPPGKEFSAHLERELRYV